MAFMTPRLNDSTQPCPEAKGKRLHAGSVEKETTVVGSVRYVKRFAVLYSDPFLGLFTDESAAEPKGSRSLAGATATQDGKVVEIKIPNDHSDVPLSIKLQTPTVEEAQVLTGPPTPFTLYYRYRPCP